MCIFEHRNYNFKTMKYIFYVLVLCIMASCQYFETDKISSDTFYDQEIKTISKAEGRTISGQLRLMFEIYKKHREVA